MGLDGATFNVINPLIKKGELKHLASIMNDGVHAGLKSTVPAFSPVAWTSMITGVNPGRHGVTDAFIHNDDYRLSFINSSHRRYKALWTILNERGLKTGVINVPVTYPPEPVDGFMITGMFTPGDSTDFTYPPELAADLKKRFGKYRFEVSSPDNLQRVVKTTYESIEQKEKIAAHMLDNGEYDLFFYVHVESDRTQHYFWKFSDPENETVTESERNKYGTFIEDVYKRLDESVGKILDRVEENDSIMIVSDHGFGPVYKAFSLSNWLAQNGYTAHTGEGPKEKPSKVASFARKVSQKIFGASGNRDEGLNRFIGEVDWSKTTAYCEGAGGGIWVNFTGRQRDGIVKGSKEYEKVRTGVIEGLLSLTDPETGDKVVTKVHRSEDVYDMDEATGAPDLIVDCAQSYYPISPSECSFYKLDNRGLFFPLKWSGRHEDYGVFMMKGPGVKRGVKLDRADIMDITPTALYLLGQPVSDSFDGVPLTGAMERDHLESNPVNRDANYTIKAGGGSSVGKDFSDEDAKQIEEQMRDLGYIE